MRTPARRLGRGLGAFLDFDPAGDDGEAFVSDAIGGAASILQTSAPAAEPAPAPVAGPVTPTARTPAPAPQTAAAPAAAKATPVAPPVAPPAPPEPVREESTESAFVDDEIVASLSFPEVDLE